MRKTTVIQTLGALAVIAAVALAVWQVRSHRRQRIESETLANVPRPSRKTDAVGSAPHQPPSPPQARPSPEALRAALVAKDSSDSMVWPNERIIRLVTELPDPRAAFEALKTAALNPATLAGDGHEQATADLVRMRAIHALQYLAGDVPEAKPFLWTLFKADDVAAKADAFSTLQSIGFAAADLPGLVASLAAPLRSPGLIRYVPQVVGRLLAQNPPQASAAVAALERLLGSEDESVRFAAACALAGTRVDRDVRVARILREALRPSNTARAVASAEALASAGPKAAALAPALVDLASQTTEDYMRIEFVRAAAAIRPNLIQDKPELAAALAQDVEGRELGQKLEADSISLEDLVKALRFPQHATLAAFRLAEMGPAARSAVPALLKALHGQDEESRDDIAEAINEIAPEVKIDRVAAANITEALLSAEKTLGARAKNLQDPVTRLVLDARKFSTWWTRDEAVAFGVKLSSMDPVVYNAYGSRLLRSNPELGASAPASK